MTAEERLAKLEAWVAAAETDRLFFLKSLRDHAVKLVALCEDAMRTPRDKSVIVNRREDAARAIRQ